MHIKHTFKGPQLQGKAELFLQHPDGERIVIARSSNRILREGVDLLSQCAAGARRVDGMYFVYTNDVSVTAAPFDYATRAIDLRSAPWTDANNGFTRNALAGIPTYSSSDGTKYNSNQGIFTALSGSTPAVPVAGNEVVDGTTKFYAACLVSRGVEIEDDMLLAGVAFEEITGVDDQYLDKIANMSVGVRWTITFETNEV